MQSIWRLISYSTHSRAFEGEFIFFISIFIPSLSEPLGRTEMFTSQRICPFSMSQSEIPAKEIVFLSEFRYAKTSSPECMSGSETISISGVPALL